jgi:hypothetical protein
MPHNPETGKTDRRARSKAELLEFRLKQAEQPASEVKRGKRRAQDSPDACESEGSGPSPLEPLASLRGLTLDSGGSSPANTPAVSPTTALPENPAPPPAPKARKALKRSAGKPLFKPPAAALTHHPKKKTGFTAEAPATSQLAEAPATSRLLKPGHRQASRSRSDPSPVSDDGSNGARIAALETRQDEVEKKLRELDLRVKQLGG